MRKLMWFALGFVAASALCAYLWLTQDLWIPALVMSVPAAGILLAGKQNWLRPVAAVCLGCAAAFLWFSFYGSVYLKSATELDGADAEMTILCSDYSYDTRYGSAVDGVVMLDGKPVLLKAYLDERMDIQPGDLLDGVFSFRVTTPDGAEEPTTHRGRGIFLLAYEEASLQHQITGQPPGWTFPARLRHRVLEILETYFPRDTVSFAKALLLGDRTGIDYETDTAFKLSGISHVIAVSGLHVTILFTLINTLCFKRRWLVAILGIPALFLFAAVAGFSPSVTRSCVMQCLMIAASVLNREYDGPTELAFSCLVMVLANPLVVTSVSFQLSVSCMIGIFLFSNRIKGYLTEKYMKKRCRFSKIKRWAIGSVSVTLSTMVTTTPLVAYYFGAVSLVGVVTNLLTLWVIGFIFYGIVIICLLSSFWSAAAVAAAAVISVPIRYVLAVSKLLASFPLAAVYTVSVYIVIWLVASYLLLAVFLLRRIRRPVVLLCCIVIGLCTALMASWLEPMADDCFMTVLDVGQGQCILLHSDSRTFLVDCGGDSGKETADLVAEQMLSKGLFRLDGMILTHLDSDHTSGAEYLLSRIPTDLLIVPQCPDEHKMLPELILRTNRFVQLKEDAIMSYGNTELTVFGPIVPVSGNESSLAVLFSHKDYDILITGDRSGFGERILLKSAKIPEVDILVAGHHGASDSSCREFLEAVRPETVVVSVGENRYGHPAPDTLIRFAAIGATVYRTDLNGTITFRR